MRMTYCTQNNGKCDVCSLSNYGWDDDGKYMVISGVISRDAANLISAAPDLFDALKTIYGKLAMSDRDGEAVITKEDGLLAESALAKATGAA